MTRGNPGEYLSKCLHVGCIGQKHNRSDEDLGGQAEKGIRKITLYRVEGLEVSRASVYERKVQTHTKT